MRNSRQIVDVYTWDKFGVFSVMDGREPFRTQNFGRNEMSRMKQRPLQTPNRMKSKLTLINDNEHKEEIKQVYYYYVLSNYSIMMYRTFSPSRSRREHSYRHRKGDINVLSSCA